MRSFEQRLAAVRQAVKHTLYARLAELWPVAERTLHGEARNAAMERVVNLAWRIGDLECADRTPLEVVLARFPDTLAPAVRTVLLEAVDEAEEARRS